MIPSPVLYRSCLLPLTVKDRLLLPCSGSIPFSFVKILSLLNLHTPLHSHLSSPAFPSWVIPSYQHSKHAQFSPIKTRQQFAKTLQSSDAASLSIFSFSQPNILKEFWILSPFPLLSPTLRLPSILLLLSPLWRPALAKITLLLNLMDTSQSLPPLTSQKHLPPLMHPAFIVFLNTVLCSFPSLVHYWLAVFSLHIPQMLVFLFSPGSSPWEILSSPQHQSSSICWWLPICIPNLSPAPRSHISNCFWNISTWMSYSYFKVNLYLENGINLLFFTFKPTLTFLISVDGTIVHLVAQTRSRDFLLSSFSPSLLSSSGSASPSDWTSE